MAIAWVERRGHARRALGGPAIMASAASSAHPLLAGDPAHQIGLAGRREFRRRSKRWVRERM